MFDHVFLSVESFMNLNLYTNILNCNDRTSSQLPLHATSRNIIYEQPVISKQYIDNVNH